MSRLLSTLTLLALLLFAAAPASAVMLRDEKTALGAESIAATNPRWMCAMPKPLCLCETEPVDEFRSRWARI